MSVNVKEEEVLAIINYYINYSIPHVRYEYPTHHLDMRPIPHVSIWSNPCCNLWGAPSFV